MDLIDRDKIYHIPENGWDITNYEVFEDCVEGAPTIKPADYCYCAVDRDGNICTNTHPNTPKRFYQRKNKLEEWVDAHNYCIHDEDKKLYVQKFALIPVEDE